MKNRLETHQPFNATRSIREFIPIEAHSAPVRLISSLSKLAGVALALVVAAPAQAAGAFENIQFGGFISQGYLKSTDNNYPVDTTDGTFDFREMAFRASSTFGTHLRVGGQLFAQTLGKYGDNKVILDWASADYNFRQEIGVRVGRVKYPRSLQSEVLDADETRPFIFLPQSIYDSRLRDFQASFDGAMVYGTLSAGQSSFDYKVFYGDIPMKTRSGVGDFFNTSSLFANPPGVSSLGIDSVRGATLSWTTPIVGLRVGLNYSELSNLLAVGPFQQMPSLTSQINLTRTQYENVSAEYSTGPWTLTAEYLLQMGKSELTLPAALRQPMRYSNFGSKAFYVAVARRLGKQFEVGSYYTELRNSYPSTSGPENKRRDLAVALRYDFNDHLIFKLEAHAIDGTRDIFNVPDIENTPKSLKDSMTLFAFKTTLTF